MLDFNSNQKKEMFYKNLSIEDLNLLYEEIKDCDMNEVEEKIFKKLSYNKLNYFNYFKRNILNWYDFKKDSSILEIGADLGDITLMLSEFEFSNITSIEFNDIKYKIIQKRLEKSSNITAQKVNVLNCLPNKIDVKYDYITLIGLEKIVENIYINETNLSKKEMLEKFFLEIKKFLKEDGVILLAFDNYLGVRNFSNLNENYKVPIENIEYNIDKIFTSKNILEILKNINLNSIKSYYPFPNYINSDIIISEDYEKSTYNISSYNQNLEENSILTFDEKNVIKNILESSNKYMSIFANSIFLEIQFTENNSLKNNIQLISFNNARKEEYRLITIIKNDVVEKKISNVRSQKQLDSIKNNLKYIEEYDITRLDYIENGKVLSKYIKEYETLDIEIAKKYDDQDYVVEKFNLIKNMLLKNKVDYDVNKLENLVKIVGENNIHLLEELNFVKHCFWDMVPKNCFSIDNKLYFFDQEWMMEYLPIEFVIYRGIINSYEYVKKVDVSELYKKLNIDKYIEIFELINNSLIDEIIDKNVIFYLGKKVNTINDIIYKVNTFENQLIENNNYIETLNKTIKMYENEEKLKKEYIRNLENKITELSEELKISNEYNMINLGKKEALKKMIKVLLTDNSKKKENK